jgi:hypothetical protein
MKLYSVRYMGTVGSSTEAIQGQIHKIYIVRYTSPIVSVKVVVEYFPFPFLFLFI